MGADLESDVADASDLLAYQEELLETLRRAEVNYRKTPKDRLKISYLEARLEILEQLWIDFRKGHKAVVCRIAKEAPYIKEHVYDEFQELYISYKCLIKEKLLEYQPVTSASSQQTTETSCQNHAASSEVRNYEIMLPRIQLPTFTGKYEEWQSFYDLFCSLIHNNKNISQVQKLHYLKANLSGEPESLLSNFSTTGANYEDAWQQLLRRYDNKRYNCNAVLRTLFAQKQINIESASEIKHMLDTTSTCLKTLENMSIDTTNWDVIIIHLVVSKLDIESVRQWENKLTTIEEDIPTWPQLRDFMECRFRSLEMIDKTKSRLTQAVKPVTKARVFHTAIDNEVKSNEVKCVKCDGRHYIYNCKSFTLLTPRERQEYVQTNKLCFNCLATGHPVMRCRQTACCKRCGRRHHSLLHFERDDNNEAARKSESSKPTMSESPASKSESNNASTGTNIVANFSRQEVQTSNVILATANIVACNKFGQKQIVRALLDQGSQASFVSEAVVQALGLTRKPVNGLVSGLGEGRVRVKCMVSLRVESRFNSNAFISVDAYVLGSLTALLPATDLENPEWIDLENLQMADPCYTTPGRIDMLLGADVYGEILFSGIIKHPQRKLVAQNTIFGWIISGKMSRGASSATEEIISMHLQVREDEMLKQFWEIENEPNSIVRKLSREEEMCEEFYDATTERDSEGRYIVRLPFKEEDPKCQYGNSKQIAIKRLNLMEKKLSKNTELQKQYAEVFDEYLQMNHMVRVEDDKVENEKAVYLPHHAVVRYDRETTKVRIVFDASCKGTNDVSLNDDLLIGPKLQQDLRHILMRWRNHRIVIVADIVKMYRMVLVAEQDTDFQRIVWRPTPNEPIQHFKMVRLTFGTACAPYLAVKTMHRLAEDEKLRHPLASEITKRDYYMDDLMTGCDTQEEALKIYDEMNQLMRLGGFQLQKWSSNNEEFLRAIDAEKHKDEQQIHLKKDMKVLGVIWDKESDNFGYKLSLPEPTASITKRQVLSEVAKLYDPMGWMAPVIVIAKILIQSLWKSGLQWDDCLTPELRERWLRYRASLQNINEIQVPRWSQYTSLSKKELHVFADSSRQAYAAAVYLRVINERGEVHVSLVTAKTKVAPIEKEISIPRLELCGAALAAKLISEVAQIMEMPKENLYAWTDSTIVLTWLRGGSSRWSTFVSNRVSGILNILEYEQWRHVTTDMNPADCASRGLDPAELLKHSLWWNGPTWLSERDIITNELQIEETHEEERLTTLTTIMSEDMEESYEWIKFSNLGKMLKVMSYCRRMLRLKLPREQREELPKYITVKEKDETLKIIIKQVQGVEFSEEIKHLEKDLCVSRSSKLRTLFPFLDQNGVLRVGGRIDKAHVPYDTRHPIILPAKSHLSSLLIADAHTMTLHGGPQAMLNYLRTKYYILRAKNQVKKEYRSCVTCARYNRKESTQLMGQIPEVRLTPGKAFKSAGVDYAGPINIKFSPGRGAKSYKGYICLFVCMVTRAIHLEAVTDMTSKGFIAAFRRFTSRRGHCQDLYSDNGTNFVGAEKELRQMFKEAKLLMSGELAELLTLERTTWHFIPPHAPNFGGLWEANPYFQMG